jgi:hypothetical protein
MGTRKAILFAQAASPTEVLGRIPEGLWWIHPVIEQSKSNQKTKEYCGKVAKVLEKKDLSPLLNDNRCRHFSKGFSKGGYPSVDRQGIIHDL